MLLLIGVVGNLHSLATQPHLMFRPTRITYGLLITHLYVSIIAMVFSWPHIRKLLKVRAFNQVKIQPINLIVAACLLIFIHWRHGAYMAIFFMDLHQLISFFDFEPNSAIIIVMFAFWYNLIYSFNTQNEVIESKRYEKSASK